MRISGARLGLGLLLALALSITGCDLQRMPPPWPDQWQAIAQAARAYNPDALPYSIQARPVRDSANSLTITATFFVTAQDFFAVTYVDSRLAETLVVGPSGGSIGAAAVPDVRASADLFPAVTIGPQEALRTALALPAVQDFITAYDDAPSGTTLFVSRSLGKR